MWREVLVALEGIPGMDEDREFTTHQELEIPNSTSSASRADGEGRVPAGQGASPSGSCPR